MEGPDMGKMGGVRGWTVWYVYFLILKWFISYAIVDDDLPECQGSGKKFDPASLITHDKESQWPLIPSRPGDMHLDQLKMIIRAYGTSVYYCKSTSSPHYLSMSTNYIIGQFTHNNKASVSWIELSRDLNHEYINSDALPEGILLSNPSRFNEDQVELLWDHWLKRQAVGSSGLVFIKAKPGAMRDAPFESP
jgi:hypothetical protein